MLAGVVDVGSNTIKMMVGGRKNNQDVYKIHERTIPVRLGAGSFETGRIPSPSLENGVNAVAELVDDAKKHGAALLGIFATSAVRCAKNADEFVSAVKRKTGIGVRILDGDEEAATIFRGVCTDAALRPRRIWVVDVGGGSVEFILGQQGKLEKKASLELGSVRLRALFCPRLPASRQTISNMKFFLMQKFCDTLSGWDLTDATPVATGGSALCIVRWNKDYNRMTMSKDLLDAVIDEVWPLDLEMLNRDPRIPPGRGDVLLAGAATYATALECVCKRDFVVSERNLRYGLVDALIGGDLDQAAGRISDTSFTP